MYDVVIRVRPDVVFEKLPIITGYSDIKDNEVLMKWIYWGLDDAFFVAKPLAMDKLLSLWSYILKTKKLSPLHIFGALFTAGATLLKPLRQEAYKSKLFFDGADADWGKMSYAKSVTDTKQER